MPKQELITTLQELQMELDKLTFENEAHKDRMNESVAALEKKLRDESYMSADEYLIEELKESLVEFEENHPGLTNLLSRISDLLAKIGI